MSRLSQWLGDYMKTRYGLWVLAAVGVCGVLLYLTRTMLPRTVAIPQLRIMTYNIEARSSDRQQLLALMRQYSPDLVLLQEVPRVRLARWFGTRLQLPYQHFAAYAGTRRGGVAILSRWPLGSPHILHFRHSKQGKVTLAAQVQTPAGTVWAGSVHLDAPRPEEFGGSLVQYAAFVGEEFFTSSRRYRQVQELQTWLAALSTGDWILGGDFNSMPLSSADRYLSKYFDDVLLQRPWRYFSGTFWALPLIPITPRIDYVYYSSRFRVVDARVIQKKISDHYPILAILAPSTAQLASPASDHPARGPFSARGRAFALPVCGRPANLDHIPCGIEQSDMGKGWQGVTHEPW
jgi:endonuclease/exonuclease/phosphatase (EEP) superfamily protein YafD